MNLSKEILEKLKCIRCDYYLSCGPVYVKNEDGEAICGRCQNKYEDEPITYNKQYEAVAELISFPCKYNELGCPEKLKFSRRTENPHEENCAYRQQRFCPITESGKCDQLVARKGLLKHCRDDHSKQILDNPCTIQHDISKPNLINSLLSAFNLLFILQTKITPDKIFHTVRLLGDSGKAKDFEYTLNIRKNREIQSKLGEVPAERSCVQESNTSLFLNINSLLEFFNGFDGVTFELTLNTVESYLNLNHLGVSLKTNKSSYEILSETCAPKIVYCANRDKGCEYFDISMDKCVKHENFYCDFNSKCTCDEFTNNCKGIIKRGTLFKHLALKHSSEETSIDTAIRCYINDKNRFLISSVIGTIVVEYYGHNSFPSFKIYSSLTSKALQLYRCRLKIIEVSEAENLLEYDEVLFNRYDCKEDWSYTTSTDSLYFDVKLDIVKESE